MKNKRINVRHNNFISARMPVLISPRTRPHGHRHAGRSRSQAIIAKDIKENKMLLTTSHHQPFSIESALKTEGGRWKIKVYFL